jgi:hypothetical protein
VCGLHECDRSPVVVVNGSVVVVCSHVSLGGQYRKVGIFRPKGQSRLQQTVDKGARSGGFAVLEVPCAAWLGTKF